MNIKSSINNFIFRFFQKRRYLHNKRMFNNYFQRIINVNKIDISSDKNLENLWLQKWSVFGVKPTILGWKAFRFYMNNNINFVPNDVARNFIEPVLTPEEYQPFYNDKNSLAMFVDNSWLPKTYFRSMDGKLYNGDYDVVQRESFLDLFNDANKLVVKPAKDMGGKGVTLFFRQGDKFVDSNNNVLTLPYLEKHYKTNFLIQECLIQSAWMAQFNPTSVNTLRIATYRDVKTGKIEIIGAVLRIGGKGAFVDNICSGGSFIFVDENGKLGGKACTEHGIKMSIYNDIDFEHGEFVVPNYDYIKQFVCNVAKRMPHMSLFANDIAIDKDGKPRLIEVNTIQFSYWLYQFNGKPVFSEYTDDLIEYCLKENKKIKSSFCLKYN